MYLTFLYRYVLDLLLVIYTGEGSLDIISGPFILLQSPLQSVIYMAIPHGGVKGEQCVKSLFTHLYGPI